MSLEYFLKGMVLGFYVVAPLGVISVLYIRRTINNGVLSGFVSALGVMTAESFYAIVVIYGLSFVSDFLFRNKSILQMSGAIFFLIIGIKSLVFDAPSFEYKATKQNLFFDYISMLFLSLINPLTIFGFIGVFATFGAEHFRTDFESSVVMVIGFAASSILYSLTLIAISHFVRSKFEINDGQLIEIFNKMSGLAIIIFTLLILVFVFSRNI